MSIFEKLSVTILVFSLFGLLAIYPDSPLAKWGELKFGNYVSFLIIALAVMFSPLAILFLVWLWIEQ